MAASIFIFCQDEFGGDVGGGDDDDDCDDSEGFQARDICEHVLVCVGSEGTYRYFRMMGMDHTNSQIMVTATTGGAQ